LNKLTDEISKVSTKKLRQSLYTPQSIPKPSENITCDTREVRGAGVEHVAPAPTAIIKASATTTATATGKPLSATEKATKAENIPVETTETLLAAAAEVLSVVQPLV